MATLYENQVVWTYGTYNSTLQLSLYYTKSRSGTTQYYSFSGTMKAVPPSGGSTHFGYNIKVYINVNGDIHTVYDKTISTANWSSDLDNLLDFSVANKTSGTTPFVVQVVSSAVGLDWSGSADLPIDPYVVAPTYNSTSAGSITGTSVVLTASINNGGATITAGGWQLSTNGGTSWTTYSGDWASKTITGLSNSTTYTYRGYATNSAGTTYSSTNTFTTLGPPTYGSTPYTGTVFYNYVELKVDTINNHGSAITAGGWQLSTDSGATWTTYAAAMTSSDSPYKKYIYNLSPATGYWYRSYATNSVGTGYSSIGYVTTKAAPPTLASPSITNITATSADLSITCTDTGGKPLTSSNIKVYTTSPLALVTTINGLSGTATGLSPNTEYKAEANAANADNSTSYGMGTFTTLAPASNVKVSLNGAAFVTGTVKLSQNGGAFVTIPGSKVKTSINGGSF